MRASPPTWPLESPLGELARRWPAHECRSGVKAKSEATQRADAQREGGGGAVGQMPAEI